MLKKDNNAPSSLSAWPILTLLLPFNVNLQIQIILTHSRTTMLRNLICQSSKGKDEEKRKTHTDRSIFHTKRCHQTFNPMYHPIIGERDVKLLAVFSQSVSLASDAVIPSCVYSCLSVSQ